MPLFRDFFNPAGLTKEEWKALRHVRAGHSKGRSRGPGGVTILLVVALWTLGLVLALTTGAGWWIGVACVVATVMVIIPAFFD